MIVLQPKFKTLIKSWLHLSKIIGLLFDASELDINFGSGNKAYERNQ